MQAGSCLTKVTSFSFHNISNLRIFHKSVSRCKVKPDHLKGRKVGAQEWLKRQLNDPFVKQARAENYRCRSAFKLIEIDDKYGLFHPGDVVIDCGAAPGSWTQVVVNRVNTGADNQGMVIGVDLQHMNPVPGAAILSQYDFTEPATSEKIMALLEGRKANSVISDMAPNATGVKSLDHELVIKLAAEVLKFSVTVLENNGTLLTKIWQGEHHIKLQKLTEKFFKSVQTVKPLASRMESAEIYILARGFKGKIK